jgi:hypothetical protein
VRIDAFLRPVLSELANSDEIPKKLDQLLEELITAVRMLEDQVEALEEELDFQLGTNPLPPR